MNAFIRLAFELISTIWVRILVELRLLILYLDTEHLLSLPHGLEHCRMAGVMASRKQGDRKLDKYFGYIFTWCWHNVDTMLTWCWHDFDMILTWCWHDSKSHLSNQTITSTDTPTHLDAGTISFGLQMIAVVGSNFPDLHRECDFHGGVLSLLL